MNFRKFFCKYLKKGWLYKVFDCQRYEFKPPVPPPKPPIEYVIVEVCNKSGELRNQYCQDWREAKFVKGKEPTQKCQLCKKPVVEKVIRTICTETESGMLANKWCTKRGCVKIVTFVKGEEPINICAKHVRPEKALKEAHYGGLGMLLWFMHGSWQDKDLDKWTGYLNRTVERIRRERFSAVDFFVWVCNGKHGNWYSNSKTPFKIENKKVVFSVWNPKWWKRFNIFIETLYRWGLEPSICPLPTAYTQWAFRNAKSGIMDFWGVIALAHQIRFVRELIKVIQKYFGKGFMPFIKANNELNNHANNEIGVMFAKWYVDLFDGIQNLFSEKDDVSKWILNTDVCEWIVFPFAYDEDKEFRGYKLGQSRFLRDGKRRYIDEMHKISCPENITDGRVDKALSANFPKKTPQRDHEDCGCGKDASGKLIGKGAGIGQYHVGNNEQTFEAQKLLHSKYKKKNRQVISAYLPIDCLQKKAGTKNVAMEFMKESELDWSRVKAFIRGIEAGLDA